MSTSSEPEVVVAEGLRAAVVRKLNVRAAHENFIPVRKADLVEALCKQPGVSEEFAAEFRQLCRLLEATMHFEFHTRLEALKNAYASFDPDADTVPLHDLSPAQRQKALDRLFAEFGFLLNKANFQQLSRERIIETLDQVSDWGVRLDVDFDVFERLEVFSRGDCIGRRSRRRLSKLYKLEECDVAVYERLVVMFRLRPHKRLGPNADTETVYIKLFKDIPQVDLEMLLPGTEVRMTLLDRAKIFIPTCSGIAISGIKLVKGALVVAAAGFYGMLAFLGLLGGTLGYGVRSYFGYLNTKQKYQLNLTQSLYFQNLDNNGGAIFRLLDDAEEQECREAMLAYYFLARHAGPLGWDEQELDQHIEDYLFELAGCRIDFEVHDALAKLERLKLLDRTPEGRLRAVSLAQGFVELDAAWDSFFTHNNDALAAPESAA